MTRIDSKTKRKHRAMGANAMLEALESRDETLVLGFGFEGQVRPIVDEAHYSFTHAEVEGLARRAGLRYPGADLRRLDVLTGRGLVHGVIAQLGSFSSIECQ